jgi:hypothetical protein
VSLAADVRLLWLARRTPLPPELAIGPDLALVEAIGYGPCRGLLAGD